MQRCKKSSEDKKIFFLGEYNALTYIINCVKNDMDFGDYDEKENNKYIKIAGELFFKFSDNNIDLMARYLENQVPRIFRRRIDYMWNGIGSWKC